MILERIPLAGFLGIGYIWEKTPIWHNQRKVVPLLGHVPVIDQSERRCMQKVVHLKTWGGLTVKLSSWCVMET